jgi:hypothetical protein
MTKPDDIDQDAWEKAWSIVSDIQMKDIKNGLPTGWEVFASIDRIARAIMSARAEEREACAKVADDFMWCLPLYEKGADANIASDDAACAVQAEIAAAIRNRP